MSGQDRFVLKCGKHGSHRCGLRGGWILRRLSRLRSALSGNSSIGRGLASQARQLSIRTTLSALIFLGAVVGFEPAMAQASLEPPPSFQTVDRFGVDVISGSVLVSSPAISIGDPDNGGLSFTATWDSVGAGWRYSNWGEVVKELAKPDPYCLTFYTVVYMGGSNVFQRDDCNLNTFSAIDGDGTLMATSTGYIYTALDGAIATYTGTGRRVAVSSIVRLNGDITTYIYSTSGLGLLSVTNNRGYQIKFEYDGPETGPWELSKVTALNNSTDACVLTDRVCAFSTSWPSLTFSRNEFERQVTDGLGRTTRITLDSRAAYQGKVVQVARPTLTSGASVTYTNGFVMGRGHGVSSVSDGSGTWTYGYESWCSIPVEWWPGQGVCPRPTSYYELDTTITDPNGGQTVYQIGWPERLYWDTSLSPTMLLTPVLESIKNPLNQITMISQSGAGLGYAQYPEGNSISVSRNDRGDITNIHTVAKGGSPVADVTIVYPGCDVAPILCHRPSSMTDARGGVTDYTYDAAGNLLTETGPAPTPGAARPQTRYTWEQRYAWYKQNGSSAITQAASPVWVQTSSSQCMTLATC